jgi:hypothetical protein
MGLFWDLKTRCQTDKILKKQMINYSLRPELDGPPAAQPIKQKFCENPLPGTFLLARGP